MSDNPEYIEITYIDDVKKLTSSRKPKKEKKVTDATMTQYEYSKLLSYRATQLSYGIAKPEIYVNPNTMFDPIEIAKEEINQRVIPLNIVRHIPDGTQSKKKRDEVWSITELNIRDS